MLTRLAVGDVPDRDIRALALQRFKDVDWRDLCPKLEAYAVDKKATAAQAADAVQSVVENFLTGKRVWNPEKHPDLFGVLCLAVQSTLNHEWESARLKYEVDGDRHPDGPEGLARSPRRRTDTPEGLPDASDGDGPPSTPRAVREGREEEALAALRQRLTGDSVALSVFSLVVDEGIDQPSSQAERLGLPVETVYDARDRISRHVKRLAKEHDEAQGEEVAQ
jgi:hypothetical protein